MAATHSDKAILAAEPTFQDRVRESMITAAVAIYNEGWGVAFHRQRAQQCQRILNDSVDVLKVLYSRAVATDATVISDATTGGTVALTSANVLAKAALVTDAHIDAAISGQFNCFFETVS